MDSLASFPLPPSITCLQETKLQLQSMVSSGKRCVGVRMAGLATCQIALNLLSVRLALKTKLEAY